MIVAGKVWFQKNALFPQVENGNLSLYIGTGFVLLEHCSDPDQHKMECYSCIEHGSI